MDGGSAFRVPTFRLAGATWRAAGPMASVTENLAGVSEKDIRAIAIYMASLSKGRQDMPPPTRSSDATSAAATIYAGACGVCHDRPPGVASQGLPLSLSSSLREARPRNTINIILHGIARRPGEPGPFMPPFDDMLTDGQIEDLTAYIRNRFTNDRHGAIFATRSTKSKRAIHHDNKSECERPGSHGRC